MTPAPDFAALEAEYQEALARLDAAIDGLREPLGEDDYLGLSNLEELAKRLEEFQ